MIQNWNLNQKNNIKTLNHGLYLSVYKYMRKHLNKKSIHSDLKTELCIKQPSSSVHCYNKYAFVSPQKWHILEHKKRYVLVNHLRVMFRILRNHSFSKSKSAESYTLEHQLTAEPGVFLGFNKDGAVRSSHHRCFI